ncbi:hypothetical protein Taro_053611 [Colocasia esculenta]|uniref:Pentatricopeptide repeat-containing protein n=1 Tax=Colocasia esculenta TaxID=4460 RepID=A0A843XMP1_COLES|nr:hypothetical protein [Colocasia esculenta]
MSPFHLPLLRAPALIISTLVLPSISVVFLHTRISSPAHPDGVRAPFEDETQTAVAYLEPCDDPARLRPVHARLIRFGVLHSRCSPFHWNCVMRAYLRLALPLPTLRAFAQMSRTGVPPDTYTMPIALKATCHLFAVDLGRQLHCAAVKHGLQLNEYCESGLISVYAKAGDFPSARKLFDQNSHRKLGSWNAIISGLAQGGLAEETIGLFMELRRCGLVPDDVTMVSVASACGSIGDFKLAQQVHKCVLQARAREVGSTDVLLHNSLVDMYGKCGRTDLAYMVFARMPRRDVSTWTSMIMGLAMHGQAADAVAFFRQMVWDGCSVRPNHVTFVSVLSACAHGGLVEEGMQFFRQMTVEYGIEPTFAHYGCVVDMLGRVGRLAEARGVVEGMPMMANSVILGTLLGSCEKHGNVEVGEWVAERLVELEPWNDGVYVVLSNIYANKGLWGEVERLRRLMRDKNVAKHPGYSLATPSV